MFENTTEKDNIIKTNSFTEEKKLLRKLIFAILNINGKTTLYHLKNLILLTELEYYKEFSTSYTKLPFIRGKTKPVILFFNEVLKKEIEGGTIGNTGKYYFLKRNLLENLIEGYDEELVRIIKKVIKLDETTISSRARPIAWKYSQLGEILNIKDLSFENEGEYWEYIDRKYDIVLE